ncbi:hypothetical protein M6B38_241500 [Iris pallida]|uniref:Uncharacterized protein n=1 Tax=Iris pallida TaxID=29817 RepID=A0AAX6DJA7_IRIPA|nr:hypothetical protein M6B38_241500 [Iris pallida]
MSETAVMLLGVLFVMLLPSQNVLTIFMILDENCKMVEI